MKQKTMRFITLLSVATLTIAISGCSSLAPQHGWKEDKTYHITLIDTNDHHGHFWQNSHGEYGMAARKTIIDNIREEVALEDGHTLLFSAGDINSGVPESDLQQAEPDFRGMHLLRYDAMALGNHEFDNPVSVLKQQHEWAGFPFLSANILDKKTGKPLFDAYKIFNVDGLKIAVVGLTTEDTAIQGNPEYLHDVTILPAIDVAKKLIPKVRKQADLVVVLSHLGYYKDAQYGGNAPGDVTLAKEVPGIDVIIGGHTHVQLNKPDVENGTMIVQAYEWGKDVGRLDLVYKNGAIVSSHYQLIPVNLKKKVTKADGTTERVYLDKEVAQDPEMLALLKPYEDNGEAKLGVKIGYSKGLFVGDRTKVRYQETDLGNLIAATMKEKLHADIAVMNSGGIRDDLPEGELTYKSVLKIQPFANNLVYVDFTASELQKYLTAAITKEPGTGAFAQFQGVSMTLKNGEATDILVNGKPLDNSRTYRVAMNSYMAIGGDGYPKVKDLPTYVDSRYVDADVMVEYIKNHSPLDPALYAPTGDVKR